MTKLDLAFIGSDAGIVRLFDIRATEKFAQTWSAHKSRISSLGNKDYTFCFFCT